MKLENHVLKAIKDFDPSEPKFSLMHACFAIEGTARNMYGSDKISRKQYKSCIRNYYWILDPMIGGGGFTISVFNNLEIKDDRGELINDPDLADVIYHIFRCYNAHAKEVPINYELLPIEDGKSYWEMGNNVLKMPQRIIWALLAVSVFAKANSAIKTKGEFYLSWGSETLGLGIHKFIIKDWWGKEKEFKKFLSEKNPKPIKVKLKGLDKLRLARTD